MARWDCKDANCKELARVVLQGLSDSDLAKLGISRDSPVAKKVEAAARRLFYRCCAERAQPYAVGGAGAVGVGGTVVVATPRALPAHPIAIVAALAIALVAVLAVPRAQKTIRCYLVGHDPWMEQCVYWCDEIKRYTRVAYPVPGDPGSCPKEVLHVA